MSPHSPSAPAPFLKEVHATQVPLQALSQQTPSTQTPVLHCEAEVQEAPLDWSATQ
jgi:hypothetical protein